MPPRFVGRREDAGQVGLLRLVARALEPPDLHRTDALPRHAPWGAVILARVVTYVAWALSVALVILVIGATVLALGIVTRRVAAVPIVESIHRTQLCDPDHGVPAPELAGLFELGAKSDGTLLCWLRSMEQDS